MDNTVGSRQREVIIGTLLGDGFLERNGRYVRLIMDHSWKQVDYLKWKCSMLKNIKGRTVQKERFDRRFNKNYRCCVFRSQSIPELEDYYNLFYRRGRKVLPRELPKIMTPRSFAVWIMDDGYNRNDCAALRINTQSYTAQEHFIIQKTLLVFGIESSIHRQKKNFVTYIPSRSMDRLRQLIGPFIAPTMKYKICLTP